MKSELVLILLLFCAPAIGQEYISDADLKTVPALELPFLDNESLVAAELQSRLNLNRPPEFARTCKVDAGCEDQGRWSINKDGMAVWQLVIESKGAESLNFGFSDFHLPPSGQFHIIGLNSGIQRGPFVAADNDDHDQFWTPIIEDDKVLLDIKIAQSEKNQLRLHLSKVNHAYMKFGSLGVSGACNLDVICGEADDWAVNDNNRDIIRSVIMYSLNGSQQCTGMLINNIREDFQPYIITANHCNVNATNAASMVVYYNFQNSVCRQPNSTASGLNGDGSLATFNSGASWISATDVNIGTDFCLVQMDDPINVNANAFISGWNRGLAAPNSAIAIHHPNTSEKRISYENDPLQITENSGITPVVFARYLRVIDWDTGTTEPGSSGSPLFDDQRRFVGQLFGGSAACGNNESDYYGRLAVSWDGDASPTTRLKDYLDPDQIELMTLDGIEANNLPLLSSPDAYYKEVCKPNGLSFTIATSNNFSGAVTYSIVTNSGAAMVDFAPANPMPGQSVTLDITNVGAIAVGSHSLRIKIEDGTGAAIEVPLYYEVRDAMTNDVTLTSPVDGAEYQIPTPILSWVDINAQFEVEIALDTAFSSIVSSVQNLSNSKWLVSSALQANTTYFWRVRGQTICSVGDWSATYSFTTGAVPECQTFSSSDVPKTLIVATANVIESNLDVTDPGQIASMRVLKIKGQHTWISDLSFTLISPAGTAVSLLSNQCSDEDNFDIGFDDNAPTSSVACPYINGVVYQPLNPLSKFIGEFASGTWTLRVSDNAEDDGGSLDEWALEFCTVGNPNVGITSSQDTLITCSNVDTSIDLMIGNGFTSNVNLAIESNIVGLNASFSQSTVSPGGSTDLILGGVIDQDVAVIIGATDGIIRVSKTVYLKMSPNPDEAALDTPANLAEDLSTLVSLSWMAADNTDSYRYEVATDAGFSTLVAEGTGTALTADVNLNENGSYFWRILTINDCDTTYSKVRSFQTASRFGYTVTEDTIITCETSAAYEIILNNGFEGNVLISLTGAPENATVQIENNPAQVLDTVDIQIDNIPITSASYDLEVTFIDDLGSTTQSLRLTIEEAPGPPVLQMPANNEADVDTLPSFVFDLDPLASSHRLQVATEATFDNMIIDIENLQSGTIDPNVLLLSNTNYFWRVAAENNCGISFSPIRQFITVINTSTNDVFDAESIDIVPNPTRATAEIAIETTRPILGRYQVYSIDGQILLNGNLESDRTLLDLSSLTKGIYLVKINDDNAFIVKKLILF